MTGLTLPKHVQLTGGSTLSDMGEFFKPSKQDQKFKTILIGLFVFTFKPHLKKCIHNIIRWTILF